MRRWIWPRSGHVYQALNPWQPGPTNGGTITSRTPSCYSEGGYVRSRVPIVFGLLAVLLLLDTSAVSAKGSTLFLERRVYVPNETAVALLGAWMRPSVTDWVIVMDPDPLWFGKRPHPERAAV